MSDFVSSGWSLYITAVSLLAIAGCAFLLWNVGREKVGKTGRDNRSCLGHGSG